MSNLGRQSDPGIQRASWPPASAGAQIDVRIERKKPVCDIVLDRRNRKNALSLGMYDMLLASLREAAADVDTRVVVLRSAGGAFCNGEDIPAMPDGTHRDEDVEAFAHARTTFLTALATFGKPVIASVNGLASGVGALLLLYCDFVVASEYSAFEFSCVKQGLVPDGDACALLASRIGLQRASEWLQFGERVKADEALRLGLVNSVVSLEALHGSTRARAQALAELPQHAMLETRRVLRQLLVTRANHSDTCIPSSTTRSGGMPK